MQVLSGLSVFAQAVGSCARKVEAKYWPLLFPTGTEPLHLIRDSLSRAPPRPHLAGIFLVIIQATSGPAAALEAAAPILAVALHMGSISVNYALAAQILAFVRRSEQASRHEQQLQQQHAYASSLFSFATLYSAAEPNATHAHGGSEEAALPASSQRVLQQHVAALMAAGNLRSLSALAIELGAGRRLCYET